jgi:FkbM family methyltransferase
MHELFKPAAWILGRAISSRSVWRETFRQVDFKGKLLISQYVSLPSTNGTYSSRGVTFDLSFSDDIQKAIYFNTYERHELRFLERYIQSGWQCVDIGANVGFYTLNLAKLVGPTGRVYAVEAAPGNFEKLNRNLSLNSFTNCHLSQAAITSADGPVRFHCSPSRNSGWGRIDNFAGSAGEIEVPGLTFDAYVRRTGLANVDFLKIDIEGHELAFLQGARDSLDSGLVKRMMVEYCGYSLEQRDMTLAKYIAAFESHGFDPVQFSMPEITAAKRGAYLPRRQILNLLFHHRSIGRS